MKKQLYFIFLLLLIPVFLPAQTAAVLEQLLATSAVNYDQAASLVLEAADVDGYAPSTGPAAFSFASDRSWVPANASGGDNATLEGVSLLIMESFGIKGGLFYGIAKNPHYAYRELVYKDIIQGRADPKMDVSGDYLLFLVGRALSMAEEG